MRTYFCFKIAQPLYTTPTFRTYSTLILSSDNNHFTTPIPLRLDLGQEAWPITRRVQGLIRQPGVSRKEARCGDQAGF